ncbi:MAG TPA: DUF4345 family protein [Nevskiaceae bacterium]|nr:DUF4345 family protein [Nevskiaceae bacterium]
MVTSIFLWISGAGWLGYGLYCLVQPSFLASAAGVTSTSATGLIELRAMYGGVQTAVGVFTLIAAMNARWRAGVLLGLTCIYFGLCTTRTGSAVAAGDFSSYTVGALAFEWTCALLALWLFRKTAK